MSENATAQGATAQGAAVQQTTFSPMTLSVLKNFSTVYKGMAFRPGQQLKTISEMSSIYAESDIGEVIPREFAIHDLNGWLALVGLFKEPVFYFHERHMVIKEKDGRSAVTYYYAGQGMVKAPPEKKLLVPAKNVKFTITEEALSTLQRVAAVLQLPELVVESDGVNIKVGAENRKEKQGNNYQLDIDGSAQGITCKVLFKMENLKLLKGGYDVIVGKGLANFSHKDIGLRYWVAAESGSKFDE